MAVQRFPFQLKQDLRFAQPLPYIGLQQFNIKPRSGTECTVGPESKLLASHWSCKPRGQGAGFVLVPSIEGWIFVTCQNQRLLVQGTNLSLAMCFPTSLLAFSHSQKLQ